MNDAKADAVIEFAKKVKDWPALEAGDEMIRQQQISDTSHTWDGGCCSP